MCEPAKRDHSYLVYHFEMGSLDGTYSNIAFENDESSAGSKKENTAWDTSQTEANSVKKESTSQCKNRQHTYETVDMNAVLATENWKIDVHSPLFNSDKTSLPEGQRQEQHKRMNCSALESNGDIYVNLRNEKDVSKRKTCFQKNGGDKKEPDEETVSAGNKHNRLTLEFRKSIQLIAILQVLIFSMAAVSLALVIMLINGTIVSPADAEGGTVTSAKLQEELGNARQELQKLKKTSDSKIENLRKELQEIKKNFTPLGTTKNVTTKVTNRTEKAGKVSFELMLNSSQQIVMKMLSEIWSSLNTTEKECHEDTASLRLMCNSTQAQIQKVSDNLKKLEAKFQMEEKRFMNETMQFKERHFDDVASLMMSINNTKMEVIDMLAQMWKTLNSTGKGQQDNTLWVALNNTKVDLQQKINNVGKIVGPVGPPGFNGSQGPAGPPGPKGAGNFSTCWYEQKIVTDKGDDKMASVDESTGHIIIAATCSTNYAEDIEFRSTVYQQKRRYICDCTGVKRKHSWKNSKNCTLHYWICLKT